MRTTLCGLTTVRKIEIVLFAFGQKYLYDQFIMFVIHQSLARCIVQNLPDRNFYGNFEQIFDIQVLI